MPYSDEDILQAVQGLDERADGQDGYFRLNVSAGVHDIGLGPLRVSVAERHFFGKSLLQRPEGRKRRLSGSIRHAICQKARCATNRITS